MRGFDGWVSATTPVVAMPVPSQDEITLGQKGTVSMVQNTRPASLFGQCATSTPIHALGSELPVGLQVICPAGGDAGALSIALGLEALFGPPPRPDLGGFL